MRKVTFFMPDLVQGSVCIYREYCSQDFQALWLVMLFHEFTYLHGSLFSYFYLSSWGSHDVQNFCSPYQETLKLLLSTLIHSLLSLFSHLALASSFKVNISVEVFCSGLPQYLKPHLCWYYLTLTSGLLDGKTENG